MPAQTFLVDGAVDYEALAASGIGADVFDDILPSAWAAEYRLLVPTAELVDVDPEALTYLFDLTVERTLGVYGRSAPTTAPRPAARLRGHPSTTAPAEPRPTAATSPRTRSVAARTSTSSRRITS